MKARPQRGNAKSRTSRLFSAFQFFDHSRSQLPSALLRQQETENRMRVSEAIKYLHEAIGWTPRLQNESGVVASWMEQAKPGHRKDIRCPYCVAGGNFKVMERQSGGDWLLCAGCGHMVLSSCPCTCSKCVALEEFKLSDIHEIWFTVHCEESKTLPKNAAGVLGT